MYRERERHTYYMYVYIYIYIYRERERKRSIGVNQQLQSMISAEPAAWLWKTSQKTRCGPGSWAQACRTTAIYAAIYRGTSG